MRSVSIPISIFLIPTQPAFLYFQGYSWIPVIIVSADSGMLKTVSVFDKTVPVNVTNWWLAFKEGNILISPN